MIPQRLLVHSCSYAAPANYDRDGNPTMGEAVTLSSVRLEAVTADARDSTGESANDRLTLYYDPSYSTPAVNLVPLGRVTWNGEEYTIRSVQPRYTQGSDSVHHYEAALV